MKLIIPGYSDVNIKMNNNNSIFTFLKIEFSDKMEDYLYNKYLRDRGDKIEADFIKLNTSYKLIKLDSKEKINTADKIRLERHDDASLKKQYFCIASSNVIPLIFSLFFILLVLLT